MSGTFEPLFSPRPFWFATPELLTKVLHAEISVIAQLLAQYPNLADLLDAPEATIQERTVCFSLLAHRNIIETVDETFSSRYEESPSLDEVESSALSRTYGLVAADAPTWVLEMMQVVEHLPHHINASLPEPLRVGGFDHDNPEKMRAIHSAIKTLEHLEQVQDLTGRVVDKQVQRLERRWAASISAISQSQLVQQPSTSSVTSGGLTRRMNKRKGWQQRIKLYDAVRRILVDNPNLQGIKFCAELDKRHAPPLFDWTKRGEWRKGFTWKEAWGLTSLRRKIRRVRQEAMKNR